MSSKSPPPRKSLQYHSSLIKLVVFGIRNACSEREYPEQVGIGHFYHIFYEGCLTNFEVEDEQEATKLYPEVEYTRMIDYLKHYL